MRLLSNKVAAIGFENKKSNTDAIALVNKTIKAIEKKPSWISSRFFAAAKNRTIVNGSPSITTAGIKPIVTLT